MKAFQKFPVTMGCALIFTVVTIIRIHLGWQVEEVYSFLLDSLQLSLALGAIFGLAAITMVNSRFNDKKSFAYANILGAVVVIVTFLIVYFFGGTDFYIKPPRIVRVTDIAVSRVSVAILISMLLFIVLAGYPKDRSDFARSFFMTHKAFIIALIYGIAMVAGSSGVAGAVQALLYRGMSSDVYAYISTIGGFLAFAIFIGYFPDFGRGIIDEKREVAQRQPRFMEILFEYIMVPIALALTVVLLLWSGKTIITGAEVSFMRLSSIATAYAMVGIWLHIMVTHSKSGLAGFYRKVYPFTALIILGFEARALFIQLNAWGLKTTEYVFIIIWIINVAAALLLIKNTDKNHERMVIVTSLIAILSVMPMIGYYALPTTTQINRIEGLLAKEGILKDSRLNPTTKEVDRTVKEKITDGIDFLSNVQDAKLPAWFDEDLRMNKDFKKKFGFEKVWPDFEPDGGMYKGTYLTLPSDFIDVSGYHWAVQMQNEKKREVTLIGDKGTYHIYWETMQGDNIPSLRIELDNKTILNKDMKDYLDNIIEKYPPGENRDVDADFDDMVIKLESPDINVMLVFNSISIDVDVKRDSVNYWMDLGSLYINEK